MFGSVILSTFCLVELTLYFYCHFSNKKVSVATVLESFFIVSSLSPLWETRGKLCFVIVGFPWKLSLYLLVLFVPNLSDIYLGPAVQNLTKLLAHVTFKFLSWNMANALILFADKM